MSSATTSEGAPGATRPRVLVVGAGGIGGVLATALHELGDAVDVTALTTNERIAAAVRERGARVTGVDGERGARLRIETTLAPDEPPFDWVLLATQPPQVEAAAQGVRAHLAPGGALVCLQNGLCEPRVARLVGDDAVVGAVVAWGASMPEPGVYERTSAGGFTLGRMHAPPDGRLANLALLLEAVGPVTLTENLAGARWSKLAINCAISTLGTLGGSRLGPLMLHRYVRRLALELMTEAVAVARAEGVKLEKVSGTLDLDWLALTEHERSAVGSAGLLAKHSMLLAVGARYRRMRSSMLAALERGRPPAVDFLNGEVADRGALHGVPTPVNAAARDAVHALARGERAPGMETLEHFARSVGLRP